MLVAGAVAIYVVPLATGHDTPLTRAAAVVVLTMGLLATGALPEYLTSLLFFLLAMLLAIAPAEVVFSGFASSTLWLVFGGLIVAEAVGTSGLGKRLAAMLLSHVTLSYAKLITLTVLFSTLLAFVMPATIGRILLLLPLFSAVAVHAGLKPGSRGFNGVALAAMMSTYQCGTAVLPANAPNLVLAGAADRLYHVHITYAEYLMVQFPVMGILKGAVIVLLICALMREDMNPIKEHAALGPITRAERRLALVLLVSLGFWATDFLHGIQPGWIALAAGIACVFPRVGVIPLSVLTDRLKVGPVFYIAAVLGLGATLSATGLGRELGELLTGVLTLRSGHDFVNFMSLSMLSSAAGLLTTNPVQPALLAPLAREFADAADWPLKAALMTSAVGFTTLILPYQVPPVVVGLHAAGLSLRDALRVTIPLAAVSLLVLVPLDYLWWALIGYFG
jgi:anion transporter